MRGRELLPFVFSWLLTAPALGESRRPPAGTYEFILCHPDCRDSTTRVGAGVFVVVDGDIRKALSGVPLDSVDNVGGRNAPNACFRVSADSVIGGREYYPSIRHVGLSAVTEDGDDAFSLQLYHSPDASFEVILRFVGRGRVTGQGNQYDWNGRGPVEFSLMTGQRTGPPDPRVCFTRS